MILTLVIPQRWRSSARHAPRANSTPGNSHSRAVGLTHDWPQKCLVPANPRAHRDLARGIISLGDAWVKSRVVEGSGAAAGMIQASAKAANRSHMRFFRRRDDEPVDMNERSPQLGLRRPGASDATGSRKRWLLGSRKRWLFGERARPATGIPWSVGRGQRNARGHFTGLRPGFR
jgi:hypothetical protein